MLASVSSVAELKARCAVLLADAGIDASINSLVPTAAGGNNRTYHLETSAGSFAVKQYFRHEGDPRDRLGTEFAFLSYAAKTAPSVAPTPLAMNTDFGLALYEFVEGRPYKAEEITWALVGCAAQFFCALNDPGARLSAAATLPTASEACFSIKEHLSLVASRLDRLRLIDVAGDEDRTAQVLIGQLLSRWQSLEEAVITASRRAQLDTETPLEPAQRCISPSDFGFHNALAQADGSPRFLDFEYGGWDDPAKMSSDFFAQLAVPVPDDLFDRFVQQTTAPFPRSDELVCRASLLRPVYQVKWCCIALNVFMPVNLARRKFANSALDENSLKRDQIIKATTLFQSICS